MHSLVSKTQAVALRSILADAALSPEEAADVVLKVGGLKWHIAAHAVFACGPLDAAASASASEVKRSRRAVQDFQALPVYFTEALWQLLCSKAMPTVKLDALLMFAFKAGMRLPAENTSKLLCSTWLVSSETQEDRDLFTASQKQLYLKHLKAAFHSLRKRGSDPVEFIETLPANPFTMQSKHPLLYASLFDDGSTPGTMPPNFLAKLQEFDMTYSCRGKVRLDHKQPSSTPTSMETIEKFFGLMVSNQGRLMELALGSPASSSNLPMCLAPHRRLSFETLPQQSYESPTSPPSIAHRIATPLDASGLPMLEDGKLDAPDVRRKTLATTPTDSDVPADAKTAPTTICAMLDMMKSRKRAKDDEPGAEVKKNVKKNKKGKGKRNAKSSAMTKVHAGTKHKPAKKNTQGGVDNGPEAAAKPAAKVLVNADPDVIGTNTSPKALIGTKTSPKAKASKVSTATETADMPKYGCSKCRFSKNGCARCRKLKA